MQIPELFLSSSPAAVLMVALIKATIALALAQWIVASFRSLSAASRHLLLSFALSGFLVIPLLSLALPHLTVFVSAPAKTVASPSATNAPASVDRGEPAKAAAQLILSAATADKPALRMPHLTPAETLALIWAAGVFLLGARLVIAALRLKSIVNTAEDAPAPIADLVDEVRREMDLDVSVNALVTSRVAVPMIWGVRSGTLLLPENTGEWAAEELRATIVHELGHLQRLDYVALALMNIVASLFWFDPQVWTARRRALAEGEHACDDLVLRSGARASEYASHLLSVARLMPRREPLAAILAMSRPTQLEGRMYAILSPSINRKAVGGKLLMFSAFAFTLLVAPLAAFQLSAAPAPPPPPPPPPPPAIASAWTSDQAQAMPRHAERAGHRSEMKRRMPMTGTCADYHSEFDGRLTVKAEENLSYSGNALEVAIENGGVAVRHGSGAFGITACKAAGGMNDAEAQQLLSQISVAERNGKITATGPDSGNWNVHLIITVPEGRAITVRGENGPVSFDGVNATIDASVINGPLGLHDSSGEIKASAVNGPVSISGSSGNVSLSTQNGPLTIDLDGPAWVGGELHAKVGNGPLRLTVPDGYQTGISLVTSGRGPLSCDGDICGNLPARNYDQPPRDVKAMLGNGPARIYVEAGNGPVSIREAGQELKLIREH